MASHGSVRIELDHDGFRQLLSSQGVGDLVVSTARRIANDAGDGFEATGPRSSNYGGGRVVAEVHATTWEARHAQATDLALTKAVHA